MYPSNYPHAQKYVPAELHQNKEWRIVYYVHNPSTGKLHRKAIKCNRIGSKSTRLSYARRLCKEVNEKLASGWNPFYEQESSKGFTKLVDALQTFKEEKDRELRVDSVRCYKSFVSILKK
ncbi:MAG: hypothetical protein LBC89_01360, partial [Bacteroidales bacterium]|nr:hypothetical protein [Bacteroidales bacterium]